MRLIPGKKESRRSKSVSSSLLAFLCLYSVLGCGLTALAHDADSPVAVLTSTSRDFGDVFAGEELEAFFLVRNEGTATLELSPKQTTGGVTSALGIKSGSVVPIARVAGSRYRAVPVLATAVRRSPS